MQDDGGMRGSAGLRGRFSLCDPHDPLSRFSIALKLVFDLPGKAGGAVGPESTLHALEDERREERHHSLELLVAAAANQPRQHRIAAIRRRMRDGGLLMAGARRINAEHAGRARFALRRDDVAGRRGARRRAAGKRLLDG